MDPLSEMHKQDTDRNRYRRQVCLASLNTAGLATLLTQCLIDYRNLVVSAQALGLHSVWLRVAFSLAAVVAAFLACCWLVVLFSIYILILGNKDKSLFQHHVSSIKQFEGVMLLFENFFVNCFSNRVFRVQTDTWYHVSVCYQGRAWYLFILFLVHLILLT